jgi:2-polyprenyl-6-methoxyphenol hydroxylase-like FAD-dependent oxidoreductase
LLAELSRSPSLYFDMVSQIEMPRWSAGRVVLIGDACHCVSLLAGQGASLAMAGAYVLASELGSRPDLQVALTRYEQRMRPAAAQLLSGRQMARWFVPDMAVGLVIRDLAMRLSVYPLASRIVRNRLAGESFLRKAA